MYHFEICRFAWSAIRRKPEEEKIFNFTYAENEDGSHSIITCVSFQRFYGAYSMNELDENIPPNRSVNTSQVVGVNSAISAIGRLVNLKHLMT